MEKEVKVALKQAREAIKERNYKEALKRVKAVLKLDKTNYNGLVFAGIASEGLEQLDQAQAAFQKAVDVDARGLLAWQGLASLYEKHPMPAGDAKLLDVYGQLNGIMIQCAHDRLQENLDKMIALGTRIGQSAEVAESLANDVIPAVGAELAEELWLAVLELVVAAADCRPLLRLIPQAIDVLHGRLPSTRLDRFASFYLSQLHQAGDVAGLGAALCDWTEKFPGNEKFQQIGLRRAVDSQVADEGGDGDPGFLQFVADDNPVRRMLLAVRRRDWLLAHRHATGASDLLFVDECAGFLALKSAVLVKCHDCRDVEGLLDEARQRMSSSYFFGDAAKLSAFLDTVHASLLLEPPADPGRALGLVAALPGPEACLARARALTALGQHDEALKLLGSLEQAEPDVTLALAQCLVEMGNVGAACSRMESIKCCESAEVLQMIGYLEYLKLTKKMLTTAESEIAVKSCFSALLKAGKTNPMWALTFHRLGLYYKEVCRDNEKAVKCLEKAYALAPSCQDVAALLVDLYRADPGRRERSLHLLHDMTSDTPAGSGKWAWLRLGLVQAPSARHSEAAIGSFQAALRCDAEDATVWECLGDAYELRGSLSSALRAFGRASELDSSLLYPRLQVAQIRQKLGDTAAATSEYERILAERPDYVPALKGLGETYLSAACRHSAEFQWKMCFHFAELALQSLVRAAGLPGQFSCIWKLLGDACLLVHPVSSRGICIRLPPQLSPSVPGEAAGSEKDVVLSAGVRCYSSAIHLLHLHQPHLDDSGLWNDLGVALFHRARHAALSGPDGSARELRGKCVAALGRAVRAAPRNATYWNSLGVACSMQEVGEFARAQHCFIRSCKLQENNAIAWSNLGSLYLKTGHVKEAHLAYKMAQSADPAYLNCWIGQAMIAELIGDLDSMDLFRHSCLLGHHSQAALGYSSWVCRTLLTKPRDGNLNYSIEEINAVTTAIDGLDSFLNGEDGDPCAWNMFALLLECEGLFRSALSAIEKAQTLASEEHKTIVSANYARLLCRSGQWSKSLEAFSQLECLSFEDRCWWALCLYKNHDYSASSKSYEEAASHAACVADSDAALVAAGMAAFHAGDIGSAKAKFFKVSQSSTSPTSAIYCLCAIGLLDNDFTLAGATIRELSRSDCICTFLTATMARLQNRSSDALMVLVKRAHADPGSSELWRHLAMLLTDCSKEAAGVCSLRALSCSDRSPMLQMLVSLSLLSSGSGAALSAAKRAVHMFPENPKCWFSLVAAAHAEAVLLKFTASQATSRALDGSLVPLLAHLMAVVEAKVQHGSPQERREFQSLHIWCVKQYSLILLAIGQKERAVAFLKQAAWLYETDAALNCLLLAANCQIKELRGRASSSDNCYVWQLLVKTLLSQGFQKDAFKSSVQYQRKISHSQLTALSLTALLSYAFVKDSEGKTSKWIDSFDETYRDVVAQEPLDKTLNFLQALLVADDGRRSRRFLLKALSCCQQTSVKFTDTRCRLLLFGIYRKANNVSAMKKLVQVATELQDFSFLEEVDISCLSEE